MVAYYRFYFNNTRHSYILQNSAAPDRNPKCGSSPKCNGFFLGHRHTYGKKFIKKFHYFVLLTDGRKYRQTNKPTWPKTEPFLQR